MEQNYVTVTLSMAAVFRRHFVGKMPRNFCYCDTAYRPYTFCY